MVDNIKPGLNEYSFTTMKVNEITRTGGEYRFFLGCPIGMYRISTVYQPYMYRDLQRRDRFFDKLVERNIESPTRKAREIL